MIRILSTVLWAFFIYLTVTGPAVGQNAPVAAPARALDPRETPRGSVFDFLEAIQAGDDRRAASFLDLRHLDTSRRDKQGQEWARMLKQVLDRKLTVDLGLLSSVPEGNPTDAADPNLELVGTVRLQGSGVDLMLQRIERDGSPPIWVFSNRTVRMIPALHADLDTPWVAQRLPAWLLLPGPWDTAWWQWFALLILTLLAFGAGRLLSRLVLRLLKPLVKRTPTELDDELSNSLIKPIGVLLSLVAYRTGLVWIAPSVLLRAYFGRIITSLIYLTIAWVVGRIIDVVAAKLLVTMTGRQRMSASSIMPLAKRSLKVIIFTFAVIASLNSWGYDTTAVLAGLGVGGLAVALAAQKTIENLFGGVAITTDKPVLIGDFCRFGDRVGTVEDVGLRSTRIRTLDRTVVTVPNAEFSSLQLENFGKRDKIWFHPILSLRRDTTVAQLRQLIAGLRQIMLEHPKIDPNAARVRFVGVGASSLDLEIFAYVSTSDGDEFLLVQEELLLRMLEYIEEVGTALAVPAQMNLLGRDPVQAAKREQSSTT